MAATLPLASVVVRDGYSYVFVVTGDQRVERRRVETGGVREGRVEIVTGLNAQRARRRARRGLPAGRRQDHRRERAGGHMNFATWSIQRPVPVIVLFVALTVAGIVGLKQLGVQDRPDLDIPIVTVR